MILARFSKLKPKPQNVADPKNGYACFTDRSAWWNNPQICSELSQTTLDMY